MGPGESHSWGMGTGNPPSNPTGPRDAPSWVTAQRLPGLAHGAAVGAGLEYYASLPDAVTVLEPIRRESGRVEDLRLIYMNGVARAASPDPEGALGATLSERLPETLENGTHAAFVRVAESGVLEAGQVTWMDPVTYLPGGYEWRAVRRDDGTVLVVYRDVFESATTEERLQRDLEKSLSRESTDRSDRWGQLLRRAMGADLLTRRPGAASDSAAVLHSETPEPQPDSDTRASSTPGT